MITSSFKVYAWDITRSLVKNTSDQPWKVKFILMNGSLDGLSECSENQECTIEKNSFKIIIYKTHNAYYGLKGMVILTDSLGHRTAFNIDKDNTTTPNLPWLTALDNNCPDAVAVNKTYGEDGDMSSWPIPIRWLLEISRYNAGGGIQITADYCTPK
jgi:hypothetical protein